MFAWELVEQRKTSTLIAVLAPPGGVSIDWAFAFANMQKPPICDVIRISGLPWDVARTQAAYQCLNRGYNWLFFLDCDVCCPPNTITRLMSHRLPIVSGLYHQRFPTWTGIQAEYLPCMFRETMNAEGKPAKVPITDYVPGSLVEADLVPGGCLLINRSVFERMLACGIKRFFEWTVYADSPENTGRSEDFDFSAKARSLGIKCYVDTGVTCIHETSSQITEKGLLPKL